MTEDGLSYIFRLRNSDWRDGQPIAAEEVRDPKRTVVRATIFGTLIVTIVYIVATVAVMGIVPHATLVNSASPFADAAGIMFGGGWDKVIAAQLDSRHKPCNLIELMPRFLET